MSIRYVVSFPGRMSQEALANVMETLTRARGTQAWTDIVLSEGGTVTRLDATPRKSNRVRHAQRLVR